MPTELYFAEPPAWTQDAPCQHEWPHPDGREHKSPWDSDYMSDKKAAELCADCPILEACLSAAMEEEGELIARNRYGIRGGKTPKQRAMLAAPAECGKGHVGHMVSNTDARVKISWVCLECKRIASREWRAKATPEQLERKRAYTRERNKRRVQCPQCGGEFAINALSRHLERKHAAPEGEVAS